MAKRSTGMGVKTASQRWARAVGIVLAVALAAAPVMGQPPIENPDPGPGGCYNCIEVYDGNGFLIGFKCHRPQGGEGGRYRYCEVRSDGYGCNHSAPSGGPVYCSYV
jgi:hypothetical protein